MLAYYMDTPTLFTPTVEAETISVVALDCLDSSLKNANKCQYSSVMTVSLATNASVHGTKHTQGCFHQQDAQVDKNLIINVLIIVKSL